MNVVTILTNARDLISDPSNWTRGACARGKGGFIVNIFDDKACQFCILGAIMKASYDAMKENGVKLVNDSVYILERTVTGGDRISCYNDCRKTTHKDVLNAFDRAIEIAKANES